jgi:dTDP-4-dehydrorhamnose reductase
MSDAVDPVLVIGANGILGRAFSALLAREGLRFSAVDLPEFDLCNQASIARAVAEGTRSVINCAAFTDVDGAETREAAATALNGDAVGALARRCGKIGATLVHYSTDYVFEGDASRPYAVDHPRAPLNAYGRSKARGEQLLEQSGARYLLIRTSWLYAPWGKNFVLTMRQLMGTSEALKVVDDQVGRPTSAEYLAERSLGLLRRGCTGAFHVTDGGQCSWHAFASAIAGLLQTRCTVKACSSAEYNAEFKRAARRPAYSVLDLGRVEAELGPSVPWEQNLAAVLRAVK